MITEANSRDIDSKNEVFAAYQELLGKLKSNKKITKLDEEKEEKLFKEKKHEIENLAKETPEEISRTLAQLKRLMIESLDELGAQILSEQNKLITLRQAIDMSNKELAYLYEIRPEADTLAALLAAQRAKSAAFEEDLKNQRAQVDAELRSAQHLVEAELREKKLSFEKEVQLKRQELHQQEQDFNHLRDLTLERQRIEFESKMQQLEQNETELNEKARLMQEEFRQSLEQERRRIEQEAQIKFEYEAKLLDKEMDAERREFNQKIAALEAKIAHLESLKYSFNKLSFNSTKVDAID